MNDPLPDYYDGLRDAPVPARLMAETPPEARLRRVGANLAWACIGVMLALVVSSLPTTADPVAAARASRLLALREAGR